jgi:acyl-CoA thioesterase-1
VSRTVALAAAISLLAGVAVAQEAKPPGCAAAPSDLAAIKPTLSHTAARIEQARAATIVAVGSSSTQGVGATEPRLSYPSQLEADLAAHLPGVAIHVLNRGKGGEDAEEELARLRRDVIAEHPDLVIWQVGTNAVLRRDDLESDEVLLRRGVDLLKESKAEIVLMDLQYAPRVVERRSTAEMEQLIAEIAEHTGVGLFRRFGLMQYWRATRQPESPALVGIDGLHMTDAGYGCLAAALANALVSNWESHRVSIQHAGDPTRKKLADVRPANPQPRGESGAR